MKSDSVQAPWHTNLFLVVGVVLTVVMALLMSQLDRLQTRLVPTIVVVAQATEPAATPTPLSAIALATALPPSPTSLAANETDVTAVPTVACGLPPEGWVLYIVQSGDTLFALAKSSGATIDEIIRVNCLEMQQLVTGMPIYLPQAPPPRVVCGPPSWWVRYTVQAGDTMFSLARSRGATVAQVMNANCMTSTRLYAGRQIYLPPGGATAVPTATPMPQPTNQPRPTNTPVPPTNTPPPPPSPTNTPTVTSTSTAVTIVATSTATATPLATPTITVSVAPLPSNTPVPATPTGTTTPLPPTGTATPIGTTTATPTPTSTSAPYPEPPTATPTNLPYP